MAPISSRRFPCVLSGGDRSKPRRAEAYVLINLGAFADKTLQRPKVEHRILVDKIVDAEVFAPVSNGMGPYRRAATIISMAAELPIAMQKAHSCFFAGA